MLGRQFHCYYHCPKFHCHYHQRNQNAYPHITRTKYRPLSEHSYATPCCNWRKLGKKTERVSVSVVSLFQFNGSKNSGSGPVCLFVTWDPNILHQAFNNLEAISESDYLTNAYAGCCVRKCWNMWAINNAWDSKHVFICGPMAKC